VLVSREGGRKEDAGFERIVELDFVRECVRAGIAVDVVEVAEGVLEVDAFRRCLYCVNGGRERSCFTGSVFVLGWVFEDVLPRRVDVDLCSVLVIEDCDASLGLRVEVERCNPPTAVVFSFADGFEIGRDEGGRMLLSLPILPLELGGRVCVVVVERVGGLMGNRLGLVLPLVVIEDCLLKSLGS
jgi:hypothetical protein